MNEIDWSKAPEWATRLMTNKGSAPNCWCDDLYKAVWITDEHDNVFDLAPSMWVEIARRPSSPAWNGEGLPPVGTVCEVLYDTHQRIYVPIVVLAHDEAGAVYRFTAGDRKGEYQSEQQDQIGGLPNFRPIRTPEQIAAQEREMAVDEMVSLFEQAACGKEYNMRAGVEALYDCNYRKVDNP